MKIQTNKTIQIQVIITMLYPIAVFTILSIGEGSWLIPILIMLSFGLLWKNLRYLFISTLLMWIVAIPLWYFFIESREGQGAAIFSASLPFIILLFIACVLIPQILIFTIKNCIIHKLSKRNH